MANLSYADYNVFADMFPDVEQGRTAAPVRVGIDRLTGKMLVGWPHVEQSIATLFSTRYHERIFREYVGSFVPHILGENTVESVITRFFWAMATAISLWEPCYDVKRVALVRMEGQELTPYEILRQNTINELRQGHARFQLIGIYMPRGHLGDRTPDSTRTMTLLGRAPNRWDLA